MSAAPCRLAFITGAASGLGLALAQRLAAEGTSLFLCDVNATRLGLVGQAIPKAKQLHTYAFDVGDRDAFGAAVQACQTAFGVPDLVILNAGITTSGALLEDITPAQWARIFATNVDGVLHGLQEWIPVLKDSSVSARIIVMGSILSHFGLPRAADYVATKHAVMALAEVAALELTGSCIDVTLACPGLVATGIADQRTGDSLSERPAGIAPDLAAGHILDAAARGDFFAFTHPDYAPVVAARSMHAVRTLAAMSAGMTGEDIFFLSGAASSLYNDDT